MRRALASVALTVLAATVVVGLGLLAGMSAESRSAAIGSPAPGAVTTVTVGAEATVWELAHIVAPAASDAELVAVSERIVTDNSLTSVQLRPGQVLRVTTR